MAQALTGSVELVEGMVFRAASGTGHTLTLDAAPEVGGTEQGPRPMELLLLGLAGCGAMDVISILRKKRQAVSGYRVEVRGERAEEHPKVFTVMTVEHIVHGRDVDPGAVRHAIELSVGRYCPAAAMLRRAARIVERYRVVDDATGAELTGQLEPGDTAAG